MPKPLMRFKLFGQSAAQEKVGYPIICTTFDNDKDIGLILEHELGSGFYRFGFFYYLMPIWSYRNRDNYMLSQILHFHLNQNYCR